MVRQKEGLYFAGQITGVEGYVESAASGLLAAIQLGRFLKGLPDIGFPATTAIGALGHYVSDYCGNDFQPMNITFGIMDQMPNAPRSKKERYAAIAERALDTVKAIKEKM